ncbi:MAG: DUF1592 domain-containing protein [Opitutales bacterium]|jgi:mono/diheme cytochrome c family protein|nr:DUF1592 domain-containing protein [Opitutales bacterium]
MNLRVGLLFGCLIGSFLPLVEGREKEPKLDAASFEAHIQPFLKEYCIQCHGPDKQKGDRRFDSLAYPIADDNALIDFQDILDLMNLGDMPPEEEEQPSADDRKAIINWLSEAVKDAFESKSFTGGETVLRRLNHREYLNTINDLFQMDMSMFDPTEAFPGERLVEHQDNIGDTLVTSGYLLNRYIEAADKIVEKAFPFQEKPQTQSWVFNKDFEQQSELNKRHMTAHGQRYLNIYEAPNTVRRFGAYAPLYDFIEGVPEGGVYRIRIQAEAMNRFHDFDREKVINDPEEPMMLQVIPSHQRFGSLHLPQPFAPDLGTFALSDDGPAWYETDAWLDKGFAPRFIYLNGSMNIRPAFREVTGLIKKNPPPGVPLEELEEDYMAVAVKHGGIPHIRIHEVQVEGPYYPEWPTKTWKTIIGNRAFNKKYTRRIIQDFANRAYRRPARKDEVNRLMRVVDARLSKGHSPFEAMKDGLKAVLCSPAFIYLEEDSQSRKADQISNYGLASRLSYFLWGSMPDEELLNLAKRKRITRPSILRDQMDRMLANSKSDRFITGFLDSWLTLRSLGDAPPDRGKFEFYYADNLEDAMRKETELYTRHMLEENLSLTHFLDSNFTFANEALAAIYDWEDIKGDEFRKVEISDPKRGGLLGQASILTVTANGVDTSPVLRGVWLLENLLGTPPSPPPPDVEPLDPDVRGATSIREQLSKHRETATCYDCHRKIDPLGFALENFDAVGQWRDQYEDKLKIDSSGELPSGESFNNIVEFKNAILAKEELFSRALTNKMLSYALGRRLEITDRPEVDRILDTLAENEGGFRDLVYLVITSEAFARP